MPKLQTGQGIHKRMGFVITDIISVETAYFLASWTASAYTKTAFAQVRASFIVLHFAAVALVVFLTDCYSGIMFRDKYQEFGAMAPHTVKLMAADLFLLYLTQFIDGFSRDLFLLMWLLYFFVEYVVRQVQKRLIRSHLKRGESKTYIVCVTEKKYGESLMKAIAMNEFREYYIPRIFFVDGDGDEEDVMGVQVGSGFAELKEYAMHQWVDEVIMYLPGRPRGANELRKFLDTSGIIRHEAFLTLNYGEESGMNYVQKIGNLVVATKVKREISPIQLILKRTMDIAGGLIGCALTVIIGLIIGPMIYMQSPGPIIFKQERVGRNGKPFTIYKFRSMYMDAEERKQKLMKRNKINGMMFKMDNDPRIIGSNQKDGRHEGIGHFIRRTSLDEFPQFFNVLKGDMSLGGTRPPTMDEWEKYSPEHRARMALRPGITGLWQVSGRSNITDFEEVVKLDKQYIDTWDILLDLKILLRTVAVVFSEEGSS